MSDDDDRTERMARIEDALVVQLQRSIARNGRLATALRRIRGARDFDHAREIAAEALRAREVADDAD